MGSCLSKKNESRSSASASASVSNLEPVDPKKDTRSSSKNVESERKAKKKVVEEKEDGELKKEKKEESTVKKEIFVIKHRKSHDKISPPLQVSDAADGGGVMCSSPTASNEEAGKKSNNGAMIRTSSCTKEEVDAILIQCGRLSRSNSAGRTGSASKKYSGSKRSYDFDHNDLETDLNADAPAGYGSKRGVDLSYNEDEEAGEKRQHRQRHRESGRPSPQGRRRTPSRERDQQQQRSGSRERGTNGSRRVSRSPGRRSETTPISTGNTANPIANCNSNNKPGKMVSVPATVSSLVMDKSNNGGGGVETTASVKRISVKRNVGEPAGNGGQGSRNAASPRSRSPARTTGNATHTRPQSPARTNGNGKGSNENQQQPVLSRNSSRNKEQSPYRRNPLSEIDPNTLAYPQSAANRASCTNNSRVHSKNKEIEMQKESTIVHNQKLNPEMMSKTIVGSSNNNKAGTTVGVTEAAEAPKPQLLTRSMSSRRSRDFDINPEVLLLNHPPAPPSSYTSLLLEDINKFHQKSVAAAATTTTPPSSFSLPQCLNKACSILEAVADLNSTTTSLNPSSFSDQYSKNDANLMEPSFHKYVTVRRGGSKVDNEDMEEQESSGSNSYVGNGQQQQRWGLSSSSWEPSSADSTGRWTSNSNTREMDHNNNTQGLTEPCGLDVIEAKRGKKKEHDHLQGFGRARVSITS